MDVLGGLVHPERGTDELWIHRPGPRSRSWSGEQFCVDAWKAGNLLRHYGIREGTTVGLFDGTGAEETDTSETPNPQAIIALFGAWTLGASVAAEPASLDGLDVLVGPADRLDGRELPPGCKAMGYGGRPEDPTVAHFEGERWSENPVQFPADVESADPALQVEGDEWTHAELLAAGRRVREEYDIDPDDRVALSASLSDPGAIIAGTLTPLLASATITLDGESTVTVAERDGAIRPSDVQSSEV